MCKCSYLLIVSPDSCSVVADASCNFESSTCDWTVTRHVSHRDGSLDNDLLWRRHRRQIYPVGPLWDRSSTDGSTLHFINCRQFCRMYLWSMLTDLFHFLVNYTQVSVCVQHWPTIVPYIFKWLPINSVNLFKNTHV